MEDPMRTVIVVALCALVSSFVLTPFCRDFFGFLQVVDRPDSDRKIHKRPVPRVGGIPLAFSYLFALVALVLSLWTGLLEWHDPSLQLILRLLPAVATIFGAGLYDDVRGLSPWKKLFWELAAGVYAVLIGVRLATPPGTSTLMVLLVGTMSVLWLVLCTNAINLIDGIDGLATGVALIASVSLLMAAAIHHRPGLALAMAPMVGCLFGFLYYNFNPASVFLGDCGSLPVGFLLGCYGLMWHQSGTPGLGNFAPLVALSLPVGEVMLSIVRRFLRKRPIFGADSNHIHHRILSKGMSHRGAALVLYGVSALTASLAVLQTILHPRMATVLLLLLVAAAYVGFRSLRYTEFGVLNQFLFAGDFRRLLRTKIHLKEFQQSIAGATTAQECWVVLRNACREAGFSYVALRASGQFLEDDNKRQQPGPSVWCVQVPLGGSDYVIFRQDPRLTELAILIVPFVDGLRSKLSLPEVAAETGAAQMRKVPTALAS
jgi:UDP-GlcNAc:undecaprenyl-phosphate GlcNAc-1-phosphate transferase